MATSSCSSHPEQGTLHSLPGYPGGTTEATVGPIRAVLVTHNTCTWRAAGTPKQRAAALPAGRQPESLSPTPSCRQGHGAQGEPRGSTRPARHRQRMLMDSSAAFGKRQAGTHPRYPHADRPSSAGERRDGLSITLHGLGGSPRSPQDSPQPGRSTLQGAEVWGAPKSQRTHSAKAQVPARGVAPPRSLSHTQRASPAPAKPHRHRRHRRWQGRCARAAAPRSRPAPEQETLPLG